VNQSIPVATALILACLAGTANAAEFCADSDQRASVRDFYAESPGAQPAIVAARTGLSDAIVLSSLDPAQAASAAGDVFPEVWAMMENWERATFLIMKGGSAFEILSGIGPGKPSTRSQYFNIEYVEPLRGHLRPDEYAAIYAVSIPQGEGIVNRGVIFLDQVGQSVFAAFISGDSMTTTPAEIAKFEQLMEMLARKPNVCP